MNLRPTARWMAALAILTFSACRKAPAPDAVCSYEPLPASSDVPSGQGAVQTMATTDSYFYAFDAGGKQLGSAHVNGMLPLKPGDYQLKINNSVHPVAVQSKTLTKCATGGVLVSGTTDEYYYVFDTSGKQLASAHVGGALSLFPGSYQARLNNTNTPTDVKTGPPLVLKSGTVNVEAPTDEYFYVFDTASKQLASSHVGRAIALFPGSYTVKINNSDAKAEVRAADATNVPVGTLLTAGSTDEYYYVFNTAGTQLASSHLGKSLALMPGTYTVKVNNSTTPAAITAATATEVKTGSIVFQGATDEYYYVFDKAGTQLGSAHLARPLSFVPGDYTAKLNNVPLPVRVEPGRTNEYQAGTLTVKSSGSEYYYVFDTAGTQLASKQLNAPVSLPGGQYSVKVGNNSRPASVTAGQTLVVNW